MYKGTKNRHSREGSVQKRRRNYSSSNSVPSHNKFRSGRTQKRAYTNHGHGHKRGARKTPSFDPSRFINTNPVNIAQETYKPKYSFGSFGLNSQLVNTIASLSMANPTPIQDKIIPEVLQGHDVIGLAETGTGKTAAFLIPLIELSLKKIGRQTLILVPTRELALQIDNELQKLSRGLRIFSVTCVGGMSIHPQIKSLRRTNHFVIGTPGRMLDLIKRRHYMPSKASTVVLDEADRMLDMGFINDIKSILSSTPASRETLFFSATMSDDAKHLVSHFLKNPITISVKKRDIADSIEQNVVPYEHSSKFQTLTSLLKKPEFKRVLIFGSMKHSVEKLARELSFSNVQATSIHGNKNHSQRQLALKKFKNGSSRVLVATDVAARGIHVENITHVINYDLPNTFEDYVHRIGRTGRSTKRGVALTFVPE